MTIREMEACSGMTRANIRFYEAEGLLQPARGENSYRNYSENDLATLKRIKLLRALGLSLEEIKQLQLGGKSLTAVLDRREAELLAQQRQNESCRQVCAQMREDRVEYQTLNAQKYLDSIERGPQADSSALQAFESDKMPQPWVPWRRLFSRWLDLQLYLGLWLAVLSPFRTCADSPSVPDLSLWLGFFTMLFLEPLLLSRFKCTPGKLLFGLRVSNDLGGRLSYHQAFTRTWKVMLWGMGLNVLLFRLIRLGKSYLGYYHEEMLPWEYDSEQTVRDKARWRPAAAALTAALAVFIGVFCYYAPELPRHRGDITVAEFCGNYNQFMKFYYINTHFALDDAGNWVERQDMGATGVVVSVDEYGAENYLELEFADLPEFSFQTDEKGFLTEVRMEIRKKWDQSDVYPHKGSREAQVRAALYSFVQAQERFILLPNERIEAYIQRVRDAVTARYTETLCGVTVTGECKMTGIAARFYSDNGLVAATSADLSAFFNFDYFDREETAEPATLELRYVMQKPGN